MNTTQSPFWTQRLAPIIIGFVLVAANAGRITAADDAPIKGQRIFTAGHSLLLYMPAILNDIAAKAKVDGHVQVGVQGIGGSHVFQHWNLPDEKNKVKPALKTGAVQVLTLSPIYLPDDGIEKLTALGLEHNPDIRVTVQEFWVPYDDPTVLEAGKGPKQVDRDSRTVAELRQMHAAYFQSMDDYIRALNRKFGKQALFIVPVGQAVLGLREKVIKGEAPGITKQSELFSDALGHAHAPVRVLSTYCHFAVIYRRSPIGLPVPAALSKVSEAEQLNRLLQELAWDAVCKHPLSGVKQHTEKTNP
ncbi:MAG: hypothetical protein HZA91_07095 [Verrucomicrobia bacterium]|nr:hypothetical protein [Verrucomicrobiota bacterium]